MLFNVMITFFSIMLISINVKMRNRIENLTFRIEKLERSVKR